MEEKQTIRKIGRDGAFLYIPKKLMKASGLEIGDIVNIETKGHTLIIRPLVDKILLPFSSEEVSA